MGVIEGINPSRLEEAGWGVIFPLEGDPAVREALAPLLDLRRQQAAQLEPGRYREFTGPDGYRPNESKTSFLARHDTGPGPVDPGKFPYYLLIVGAPNQIPYRFQMDLDLQYAVGRLHFDTPEEYARYADSIVAAETSRPPRSRRVVLFGTRHPGDQATCLTADKLVQPLAVQLAERWSEWEAQVVVGDGATKTRLQRLLGGDDTPALLLAAAHGLAFPNRDPRQLSHQGALLCQDWPGPLGYQGSIPEDFYLTAADIDDSARLGGLLAMFVASYSAGTPQLDDVGQQVLGRPVELAPVAFVARLAQRLLAHPRGGALAVLGHAGRAWGYAADSTLNRRQTEAFGTLIEELLRGSPVGLASEFLNYRYAELSTLVSAELEDVQFGKAADVQQITNDWAMMIDLRGYALVGDPAVRLAVESDLAAAPA